MREPSAPAGTITMPLSMGVVAFLFACPVQAQLAPANEAGVTFSHVHLAVADVELHKRLWTELFDGVLAEKAGYVAVRVPGALIFLRDQEPTAPSQATAMDHFGFRVRDLEALLAQWRALGYDVDEERSDEGGPARAYITMPSGARLALEEAPDLQVKAEMDHVHFFTPEPGELSSWYGDLFGATLQDHLTAETTATLPGSRLRFSYTDEGRAPTDSTAIDHIGFEVADMNAFAEMLRARGVEFVFGPLYIESLGLWVAFFPDPSGVLVEISEGLDTY